MPVLLRPEDADRIHAGIPTKTADRGDRANDIHAFAGHVKTRRPDLTQGEKLAG
jgi:hypothetical protein